MRIGKLRGDSQAVPGATNRAFDESADIERPTNLLGRNGLSLESVRGRARCDAELRHPGKSARQLIGHSVREVLVLRIAAVVRER